MSCEVGGVATTWEFPGAVLDQLNALLPGADKRAGAVVEVTRQGEGLATRYTVTGAVGPGVGDVQVPAGHGLDHDGVVSSLLQALAMKIPAASVDVDAVVEGVKAVLGSAEYLDMVGDQVAACVMLSLTSDKVWPGGLIGALAEQIEEGLAESQAAPVGAGAPDA